MPTYIVRPGRRFGVGKKYGPGDRVELTEAEAAGFLDLLQLETKTVPADDARATRKNAAVLPSKIAEALVAAGILPADTVISPDEDILAVEGIGPAALKVIREAYPVGG